MRNNVLTGALADQARIVGGHERAHVETLRQVPGAKAAPSPFFNFAGATESPEAFRRTAVAFEDLAVADEGNRWIERILSVTETCRLQCRPALAHLTDAATAAHHGRPAPSLLPP